MPPSFNPRLLFEPRWRPTWLALLAVLVAVVSWFAFKPDSAADPVAHLDKLRHIGAFLCLAAVASMAWAARPGAAPSISGSLLAYGALIELVQSQLPTRSASLADLVADALGIALGLWLVRSLRNRL